MTRNILSWASGCAAWLAAAALAQSLNLQPFTGNGVLAWEDVSTTFMPAQCQHDPERGTTAYLGDAAVGHLDRPAARGQRSVPAAPLELTVNP